jgi:VPDSG-CTERM motif
MKTKTSSKKASTPLSLRQSARRSFLLVLTAVAALSVAHPARATFIVTIEQDGANVDVNGSGTINLTALTFISEAFVHASMVPNAGFLGVASGVGNLFTGVSGPNFGSGVETFASFNSGDAVGIEGGVFGTGFLLVPLGYVSGDPLLDSSTYGNATFASLGITPGTYIYTWGTGANADRFELLIGGPGVPDGGSTVSLLGSALLGLAALRRKLSLLRF